MTNSKSLIILLSFLPFTLHCQKPDKYLIKSFILADKMQYNEALESLNFTESKTNKDYPVIEARILYGLKNYEKSLSLFQKTEEKTPGKYQLEIAQCNAQLNKNSQAIEHLKAYFKNRNKLPLSKVFNDDAFQHLKNTPDWEKLIQNLDYSELEIKINQIRSLAEIGINDNFTNALDDAIIKYPSNAELKFFQSVYFQEKGIYDAALKSINQALEQNSGNDKFLFQKSKVLQNKSDNNEALISLNEAIERNPYNYQYYINRLEVNRKLGNTEKAIQDIQFLEFCIPSLTEVVLAKVKMDIETGNYLTAKRSLDELIAKEQSNPQYYILRGNLRLKTTQIVNADLDFGMALDLNPDDPNANLGRGISKYKLNDLESACYYWQKSYNAGSKEAHEYLLKYCQK